MKSKKIDFGSKDIISNLPEPLICQILSFLPTKESALTSLLSKKWRYLFALAPNLEFDHFVYRRKGSNRRKDEILSMFTDFVDRVLDLRGNSTINKFTLKCGFHIDSVRVIRWILNVLDRSVSNLDLCVSMDELNDLPSKIFMSKSLVRLRIVSLNGSVVDVGDVYLPKLKDLYLDSVMLGKTNDYFPKLLSCCHVLEELVLINVYSNLAIRPVSSKTLKRLRLHHIEYDQNPESVSFDTPNLVYLEYSDFVAGKYPKVNFGSLVEASLNVQMTDEQSEDKSYGDLVANAADFLMGVCNVQILHLSSKTLEVLTYCCEPIPVFNNLIHLTINTRRRLRWESLSGWESLPALLKNCPNLETLVFKGLNHKNTIKCGDVDGCLCKFREDIPTCLSSSPVKVLKILKFGFCDDVDGMEKQMELVKHFLESMPELEQMILYYDTPLDEDVIDVFKQLQRLPRVASTNCKIQVISNNLILSSSLSTSGLIFFNSIVPFRFEDSPSLSQRGSTMFWL